MTTIDLSDVPRGKLYDQLDTQASVRSLLGKPVEAMACAAERMVTCDTTHAFAKAAHDAFYDHHPLVIRPDDIWLCIAQGFATHVGQNQEALRSHFVRHDGKKKLSVERPDFFLGQENPWQEVFAAFSTQIGDHVGDLQDLIRTRFSTSTPTEIAAFDVCLMDTFQGYFEYEMMCGCGIPEITLLGTPDDWKSMIPKVKQLSTYGLEAWCSVLLPIIEKIADTAAGSIDKDFWRSFFRYQSGSGPAELTGWIVALFPYLIVDWNSKALGPNTYLATWQERFKTATNRNSALNRRNALNRRSAFLNYNDIQGPSISVIPGGLVSAPVHYVDLSTGQAHNLRFIAGMFGVEQNTETLALAAAFGWAIVYD